MRFRSALVCLALGWLMLAAATARAAETDRVRQAWKGDLPELIEAHRPIRVLVVYNRTNFFMVQGVMRGLEADMMRAWEEHLAKEYKKELVRLVFVPVPFNELFPALLDGRGDVVAAGVTVTADRARQATFAAPYRTGVREVVVGGPKSREPATAMDLSGRKVTVVAGTSYAEHLGDLNARLKHKGRKPVKIAAADPYLATEDLFEMASRNVIEYTVADEYVAELWQKVYPDLKIFDKAELHADGQLAWAVRKDCPELKRSLSEFAATVRQGTLLGNMFFKRYYVNEDFVSDPMAPVEIGKLGHMAKLFQKYGKMYDFDWLKIAAQAYQESRFDMSRVSKAGAVGVMQIKPSTAAGPNVDIKDVTTLDNNIHAGVKYLRYLVDNYFADVDPAARMDFALAAYNAGPSRIMQVRKEAAAMGLDPDRWFGNCEWAAFDLIGRETTGYVAQVQMYYAAYKGSAEILLKRREAM